MNFRRVTLLLPISTLVLTFLVPCATAQESSQRSTAKPASEAPQPGNTYRLVFMLTEIENGKKINAREYSTLVQEGEKNVLKIGKRAPVETGYQTDAKQVQISYLDIGTNIECRVEDVQRGVLLTLHVEFSNIAAEQASNPVLPGDPVLAQVRTDTKAMVDLGKPTIVSRMDEPASKRTFELEVTATKVN